MSDTQAPKIKIIDQVGNELASGKRVLWIDKKLYAQVLSIEYAPDGQTGALVVAVPLPFQRKMPDGKNVETAQFPEFVCIVDPQSNEQAEDILNKIQSEVASRGGSNGFQSHGPHEHARSRAV
jgi:hypothetical protein